MSKYYDDALPAVWMAREHGVVYATKSKIDAWSDREAPTIISEAGMHNSPHELYTVIANEIDKNNAVYIHEDSLPIFKPMIGDLIFDEVVSRCNYEQYFILQENTKCGFGEPITDSFKEMGCFAILQRDGKQFFTPQEEV